jgi:serine/threonine-protein kinase
MEMKAGLEALHLVDLPGRLDLATRSFNVIIDHDPQNAAAVAGLAITYVYRYRFDDHDEIWLQKAIGSVQQSNKLNDRLVMSRAAYSMVLAAQGKWEQSEIESSRALALGRSVNPISGKTWRVLSFFAGHGMGIYS